MSNETEHELADRGVPSPAGLDTAEPNSVIPTFIAQVRAHLPAQTSVASLDVAPKKEFPGQVCAVFRSPGLQWFIEVVQVGVDELVAGIEPSFIRATLLQLQKENHGRVQHSSPQHRVLGNSVKTRNVVIHGVPSLQLRLVKGAVKWNLDGVFGECLLDFTGHRC